MTGKKHFFTQGLRDGLPIALGYFTVSLSLGIVMSAAGISPFAGALMSFTNMTSAGQFAGVTVIAAGSSYLVMVAAQLVINARYLLMSCALSQRLEKGVSLPMRLLLGITVTDEIFGISIRREETYLEPLYSLGAFCVACPGWTLGTLCGALLGNVLPDRLVSALGVALFGMLIAVFVPQTRKDRSVLGAVAASMAVSALFYFLPLFAPLSPGLRIILITVLISGLWAALFPVKEAASDVP